VKIYTRTGDDGTTGLIGPGRVPKNAPRIEAYGTVDELNSVLGAVLALDSEAWLAADLAQVQSLLLEIGAELATPERRAGAARIADRDVAALEAAIDRLDRDLPALAHFIHPGGSNLAAQLHVARTVCRRAERRVVALLKTESVDPVIVRWLNRLADLLFTMARWCNARAGIPDRPWEPRERA
jgi:cob(I)alamin adenosyltransferase